MWSKVQKYVRILSTNLNFVVFIRYNLTINIYFVLSVPLTINVNKPKCSLGQKNLFEVLKQSLENTNDRTNKDHATIQNLRESASQSIKVYKLLLILYTNLFLYMLIAL